MWNETAFTFIVLGGKRKSRTWVSQDPDEPNQKYLPDWTPLDEMSQPCNKGFYLLLVGVSVHLQYLIHSLFSVNKRLCATPHTVIFTLTAESPKIHLLINLLFYQKEPQPPVHCHNGVSFTTPGRTLTALWTKDSGSFGYYSNKPSDHANFDANVQPVRGQRRVNHHRLSLFNMLMFFIRTFLHKTGLIHIRQPYRYNGRPTLQLITVFRPSPYHLLQFRQWKRAT